MHEQKVSNHQFGGINQPLLPVTDDCGSGTCQQRNAVKQPLCADFLHCCYHNIEEGDADRDQGIGNLAQQNQSETEGKHDDVDGNEEIFPDDLPVGAAALEGKGISPTSLPALFLKDPAQPYPPVVSLVLPALQP